MNPRQLQLLEKRIRALADIEFLEPPALSQELLRTAEAAGAGEEVERVMSDDTRSALDEAFAANRAAEWLQSPIHLRNKSLDAVRVVLEKRANFFFGVNRVLATLESLEFPYPKGHICFKRASECAGKKSP